MADMNSIHATAVNAAVTISQGVENIMQDMQARAANVGKEGGMTVEQFNAYLVDANTRLQILKDLLDSIKKNTEAFYSNAG